MVEVEVEEVDSKRACEGEGRWRRMRRTREARRAVRERVREASMIADVVGRVVVCAGR